MNSRPLALFPPFLILAEFAVNLSNDMYVPALTRIAAEFNVTDNTINTTMIAWFVGVALPQLWIGPLSDRMGRRPVLFGGGFLFLVATLICALSASLAGLLIGRLGQGVGVATLMVAGYSCVSERYTAERATRILASLRASALLAPMVGPTIGGYLLLVGPWQLIFWVILAFSFLGLFGLFLVMPETVVAPHPPVRYDRILRNPLLAATSLTLGLGYAGLVIWLTGSSFMLVDDMKLSEQTYGLIQVPIFLSYFIGAKLVKSLLGLWVKRHAITVGLLIAFLGGLILAVFSYAPSLSRSVPSLVIPMCVYALGFGMTAGPLTRGAIASSGQPTGAVTALFFLYLMALNALGALTVSLIYNHTDLSISEAIAGAILLSLIANSLRKNFKRRAKSP